MSACSAVRVPIHCTDELNEKIEAVYDRITQRAYEKWLNRRASGQPVGEFWCAAERELLCRPTTQVREWGHGVSVQIVCPNVDPSTVRLFMTANELLVLAPLKQPGHDRWLFEFLRFQKPVDHTDAFAEFEAGGIRVEATALNAPEEKKMHFQVA
jgi:hypothetical protein